jgi:hypothetical protein
MIAKAFYSFNRFENTKPEILEDEEKYNRRASIPVNINSPLSRNLLVMILYRKDDSTGAISNVKITLHEQGWGMPGLVEGDISVMQTVI